MSSPTSLNAAESVRPHLPRLRAKVFDALRFCSMCDEELVAFTGLRANTVRPRRCELVASGLVVDSGITRPTNSGRDSTVWRLATAEEREAFEAKRQDRELESLKQAKSDALAKYLAASQLLDAHLRQRGRRDFDARRAEVRT